MVDGLSTKRGHMPKPTTPPTTIDELVKMVRSRRVHQIRAGETHRFIDISIVETEGRFFVRQYQFGSRSWYHAFLSDPAGAMKLGDIVVPVDGVVPDDLDTINPKVTRAFWRKYHVIYAVMRLGFDTRRHEASTLELIPHLENA